MGTLRMPSYDQICALVNQVLAEHAKPGVGIDGKTELVADLGLDSVQVMELLLSIEEHFDISFPLNALPDIRTVNDLCLELQNLTQPRP
jgi:acyl carrier protein